MAHPITEKYKDMNKVIKKFEDALKDAILQNKYIVVREICLRNNYSYDYIMELKREMPKSEDPKRKAQGERLAQAIKNIISWQEVICEKKLIIGEGNLAGVIFKLKQHQHGWTDRQQIEHSATDDIIKMIEAKNKMIKEAIDNSDL